MTITFDQLDKFRNELIVEIVQLILDLASKGSVYGPNKLYHEMEIGYQFGRSIFYYADNEAGCTANFYGNKSYHKFKDMPVEPLMKIRDGLKELC